MKSKWSILQILLVVIMCAQVLGPAIAAPAAYASSEPLYPAASSDGVEQAVQSAAIAEDPVYAAIDSSLGLGRPSFMFFYTDWCGYCQQEKPIIDELELEYGGSISFIRIDGDSNPEAMQAFGVSGYPTMLLVSGKNGNGEYAYQELSGFTARETLERLLSTARTRVYASGTGSVAESIAAGLADFGRKLDDLGFLDALGEPIPLTGVSPSDDQALRLYRLFRESLDYGLAGFTGDLADLESELEALSGDYSGVQLDFTDVSSSTSGTVTDFSFKVAASREESLPVAYYYEWVEEPRPGASNTVSIDLNGGGLPTELHLSAELHFQYDSALESGSPELAFYLVGAPEMALGIETAEPVQLIEPFDALFGFTEIEVSGNVTLNDSIAVSFNDPDDNGRITLDEWTHAAPPDLFIVDRPDAGEPDQGIVAALELEAKPITDGAEELVPGSPDGRIGLEDNDLSNGLAPPVLFELGELARLDNVQADDVLLGLAALAAGLVTAQGRADSELPGGRLPFLADNFSDAFSAAEPLSRFVREQGDAAIICGTVDSDPPSGDAWHVAAGTTVYCQAITVSDAVTATWSVTGGTVLANPDVTATVGPNPTRNQGFLISDGGAPQVEVEFTLATDPEGVTHTVTPRFRSAQELFAKLSSFPDFTLQPGNVTYDGNDTTLIYRFGASYDPEETDAGYDFSDRLQEATGLAALEATADAEITIDAGPVEMDLTFGAILVDNYEDITPDDEPGDGEGLETGLSDRFFVRVHDGPEVWVDDIAFPDTTVDLVGTVGFVEVVARGEGSANAFSPGVPFEIVRSGSEPMLALDFIAAPDGIPVEGIGNITEAILISDLASDREGAFVLPVIRIDASAGLLVEALADDVNGDRTVMLGNGTVSISWPDIAHSSANITASESLTDTLRVFDIEPSLFGTNQLMTFTGNHTADASSHGNLTNTDIRFLTDWGVVAGNTTIITNTTNGAWCEVGNVTEHSILCSDVLSGGEVWEKGDDFELVGPSTTVLYDANTTFPEAVVGTEAVNLTDGSRCLITAAAGNHTLRCASGLTGGADGLWEEGDRYRVGGDPTAMRDIILDELYALAYRLDNVTAGNVTPAEFYFSNLPALGLSPYMVSSQFGAIEQGINAVRSGVPDAVITCGANNTAPPSGDLSALTVENNMVYCQATTGSGLAVTEVEWAMTGGDFTGTVTPGSADPPVYPGDLTDTVGSGPTASAAFEADEPAGIQVAVAFTDALGSHFATFPASPLPASLQSLERVIEFKLGLPPGGLMLNVLPLVNPAGPPEVPHLVVRLGQGVCTPGHAGCAAGDRVVAKPDLEIQLDLGPDLPAFLGNRTASAQLEYASRAHLDMGFPLSPDVDYGDAAVLETSGLSMELNVDAGELDFAAGVGPVSLTVGREAGYSGTHDLMTLTGNHTADASSAGNLTNTDIRFVTDWGVVAGNTTIIRNTSKGDAWCEVAYVTEHRIECKGNLTGGEFWVKGDDFELVGPSTKVLHDTGAAFPGTLVGQQLYNESDGANCTISEVLDNHTLRCETALSGDASWDDGDDYFAAGVGVLKFGAGFQLAKDGFTAGGAVDSSSGMFTIDDFAGNLTASLEGLDGPLDCGNGVAGDLCARMWLEDRDGGDFLGELSLSVGNISDPDDWDLIVPAGLTDAVANAAFDFSLVTMSLEAVRGSLAVALDGNDVDLMLPLIGTRLDAGAELATLLRNDLVEPMSSLGEHMRGLLTPTTLTSESDIKDKIWNYMNVWISGLLLDRNGDGLDKDDIDVEVTCKSGPGCGDGNTTLDVNDVRLSFTVGNEYEPKKGCADGTCPGGPEELPFDIGLPGVSLFSDDPVESRFGWRLEIRTGGNRTAGAFLDVGDPDSAPDLVLGANVTIKGAIPSGFDPLDAGVEVLNNFSDRGMTGQIGLLPVAMRDGKDGVGPEAYNGRSYLELLISIDLVPASVDGPSIMPYEDLADGMAASTGLDADANVDLRFRTTYGFSGDEPAGFPTVLGTFHMLWDGNDTDGDGEPISELKFGNLWLDPGEFIDMFLEPIVGEVQRFTKPVQPVVDTLMAPLPVISDLSRMGGGGDVTLFSLLQAATGGTLTLIERLLGFIKFVNSLPESGSIFPLGPDEQPGDFSIDVFMARTTGAEASTTMAKRPCYLKPGGGLLGPEYCAYKTYQRYKKVKQEMEQEGKTEEGRSEGKEADRKASQRGRRLSAAKRMVKGDLKSMLNGQTKTFKAGFQQPPSISLPFLEDSRQIFYALLGQDVTLIRVDFGSASAMVGMYYKFRIQAGPIPVALIIGGKVSLEGRLAMGYDTRGFGPLLAGEAGVESLSGSSLLDGIFLDDFDSLGQDVAEIKLVVEVTAGAAVDLVIISVGVEAGLSLVFSLDFDNRLHDPPGSGKLRITTIANIQNPLCLFVFKIKGELFFRLFVEINFFFFKKRFSWEPFPRIVLFTLEMKCEPPEPVLAHWKTDGVTLVLNMGDDASQRRAFINEEDEKFIVRQNTPGSPANVTVEAFGFVNQYTGVTKIMAWAGDGKDTIRLEPGLDPKDPEGPPVPFTLPSELHGEGDNDRIMGGDGDDKIYGDGGNDRIAGRGGDDELHGGTENDSLDGGFGDDVIYGDGDEDTLSGGAGSDYLDGGAGDDTLEGGPGIAEAETVEEESAVDLDDILVGGDGSDLLRGHYGDDLGFGDGTPAGCSSPANFLACYNGLKTNMASTPSDGGDGADTFDGAEGDDRAAGGGGDDSLVGGPGNDWLYGNSGNDLLDGDDPGTPGDDLLYGGNGDDTLLGWGGHDFLHGGGGDDLLRGGDDADDMIGGSGSDALVGEVGFDIMLGDIGTIAAHAVSDHALDQSEVLALVSLGTLSGAGTVGCALRVDVYGGLVDLDGDGAVPDTGLFEGYPVLAGGLDVNRDGSIDSLDNDVWGAVFVIGGKLDLDADGVATDDGTMAGVAVYGDSRGHADCMWGAEGNDYMYGGASSDVMFGDAGVDYMEGNDDGDSMRGGRDGDDMYGCGGNDTMYGDSGDDYMEGNEDVDTMRGGEGEDRMLGGSSAATTPDAGDEMYGDGGTDIMLGDNGVISTDGQTIETIDPEIGGNDTMQGSPGDDIMLGGAAGDDIWGNTGADVILGDSGNVTRTAGYVVKRVATTDPDKGGNDTIAGNEEPDIILGGTGDDWITGDDGNDTILGDNGVVVRADGTAEANDIYTTDPTEGGSDIIWGNAGDDIVLGGAAGDGIWGNTGGDVILGDNGYITRTAEDAVEVIATTDPAVGGSDTIAGNEEPDIILGGADGDTLAGDGGDDVILGDNGRLEYLANDDDVSTLDVVTCTDPTIGGADDITGGSGDDMVFGGTDSDTISGNGGSDILLGDHGLFDDSLPPNQSFVAIHTGAADGGAADIIHGNGGDDFVLGQQGDDEIYGDAGQDDLTGGHNVPGGADGGDTMYGESDMSEGTAEGSGADVMLGDNGNVTRPLDGEGNWIENSYNGSVARIVTLFDVEVVPLQLLIVRFASSPVPAGVSGNDTMWGNDNDDIMYGQGCGDEMHGGAGDDYMEGNAASDHMYGDTGQDDMLGGTGPTTSNDPETAVPGRTDVSTQLRPDVPLGEANETVPLGDTMYGGDGADVMLGDNGIIERPLSGGLWIELSYVLFEDSFGDVAPRHPTGAAGWRIERDVTMVDFMPGEVAGSDLMYGGAGDDDLYGQFDDTGGALSPAIGDELYGGDGEDAMLGDQGVVDSWVVETESQYIAPKQPFLDDDIFILGTLFREVVLEDIDTGGNDRMSGGSGGDWMHGGAGEDLMNGDSGNDRLFGDDGDDVMWGGMNHDHLWGGYGDDNLDIKPRPEMTVGEKKKAELLRADPLEWFAFAEEQNYEGVDYIYGGWDQDAMQANVADNGPVPGDRLLDWVGAYNVYYLCPGLYGERVITRAHCPGMIEFLQQLAEGDGAYDTATDGSSGFSEIGIAFTKDSKYNSNPVHPDNPGHFTCN